MKWLDLQKYKNVPDRIWKANFDYFCANGEFENIAWDYWGDTIWEYKILSYKRLMLGVVDYLLKYGSEGIPDILANNKDFIMEALLIGGDINLHSYFRDDDEITLAAITTEPGVLKYMNGKFKENKNFMMYAVQRNGFALMYASNNLKCDKEVLCTASAQLGIQARDYRDIVFTALEQGIYVYHGDMDMIRADVKLLSMYQSNMAQSEILATTTAENTDIILQALKRGYFIWNDKIYDRMKIDRKFCLLCVSYDGYTLSEAGKFRKDQEVVFAAVRNDGNAMTYADRSLKKNRDFMLKILREDRRLWMFVDNSLKCDRDFIRVAWDV